MATSRKKPTAGANQPATLRKKKAQTEMARKARTRDADEPSSEKPHPANVKLQPHFAVADGLAALFKPFVEVIVHDLVTDKVAYVAQPFSPRAVGDPSELSEASFDAGAGVIGPYEKINWDGRRIKSVSIVLRDALSRSQPKAIGLMCINTDVTEFDSVRRMLQGFLGVAETSRETQALFLDDWHEKINRFVAAWTAEHSTTLDRLDRSGRQALVEALYATGGFDGRRAPAYVAEILGVSRATLYNQLARLKAGASSQ
jgi:predicted transcriptional regulator YheO